jgi:hypothetical protein
VYTSSHEISVDSDDSYDGSLSYEPSDGSLSLKHLRLKSPVKRDIILFLFKDAFDIFFFNFFSIMR